MIDDMPTLDVMPLKTTCLSLHWKLMFTRSRFETPDMAEQDKLLAEVAEVAALVESGKAQGKVVLEGF
ncbi:hypothetical protein AX767_12905 [Variovorax sp. PAMC 28711]|nr:hypothetical protein AX767_12905 [Variovorax sp. PAMC 28711]